MWRDKSTLIVADIHIGKAAHFRKAGVAIPPDVNRDNLWRLAALLLDHRPERLLILGDLVHSHHNREWDDFVDMRRNFTNCEFVLIRGNHDVLAQNAYDGASIHVHPQMTEDQFSFVHEPGEDDTSNEELVEVCGHLHPAVRLKGAGRQSLRLPCFWLTDRRLVMPAFGAFTGTFAISPAKTDRVYAIAGKRVIEV